MKWRHWIGTTLFNLLSLVLAIGLFAIGSFDNVSKPWRWLLYVAGLICFTVFVASAYLMRPGRTETPAPTTSFDLNDSSLRARDVDSDADTLLRAGSSDIEMRDVRHLKHRRWFRKGG
jgi:hypothetical protein